MAVILYPIGALPTQSDAGLDQLIESYKTGSAAEDVLTDVTVPQRYDPHPKFPFMFLMQRRCRETSAQACELDLIYEGCMQTDANGNPLLPLGKHQLEAAVQTATAAPSGGLSLTLWYRSKVPGYTWLSQFEGQGGISVAPDTSANTGEYFIDGLLSITSGFKVVNGITGVTGTSAIAVGDSVGILTNSNDPRFSFPGPIYFVSSVTSVSGGSITLADTYKGPTFRNSVSGLSWGFHVGNIPVTVIGIKMGCGFASVLSGKTLEEWGPILASAYFNFLTSESLESHEIVPGKFWSNVQRTNTTLIPLPC